MKKLTALLLTLAMSLSMLVGCGGGAEAEAPSKPEADKAPATSEPAKGEEATGAWEPTKNVTVLVPWAAGGGADVLMRAFVATAEKYTDATMIIKNEEGAGGVTGTQSGAIAAPDGHTMVIAQTGPLVTQPIMGSVPYDPATAFDYIGALCFEGVLVCVTKDSPYQTLEELIAAGQQQDMLWSCTSVGAVGYFFGQNFVLENDIKGTVLPCAGGAEAVTNLIGGQVDYAVVQPSEISAFYESGDVVVLGLGEAERNPLYPDMITMLEQDYQGYEKLGVLRALALPAGTPPEIMDWYVDLCEKVAADEEFIEMCGNSKQYISWFDGDYVAESFANDLELYSGLAKELGLLG